MKFVKYLLVLLAIGFAGIVQADTFPSKPIKIITNLPIGSGPEVFVRKVANELEKKYSIAVTVENKPGGAGIIAIEHYLSLPADGHSILYTDFGAVVAMPILYNREHQIEQLRALTNTYVTRWIIVAPSKIKTIDDLRNALKESPRYGSWGVGSGGHLCGQEISTILGIKTDHVPYKDQGVWYVDMMNGILPFGCTSIGSSQSYQKSGKMSYIATTGMQRDILYPDLPTIKELTNHVFQTGEVWSPLFVNKKVNSIIADKLEKDLRDIIDSDGLKEQAKVLGAAVWAPSGIEMSQEIEKKTKVYKTLIKKYNITVN
jgi:tripartite-type tricarboxylate transporter receptor subunit TctC